MMKSLNDTVTFQFESMNTAVTCTLPCSCEAEADLLEREAQSWFDQAEERFQLFPAPQRA
ncbi:hypothetical protein [Paenibacillus montanisoli]|uniref:hypothetical protein n=1 Tax=Paenibacillus montanisoli TaxID=2081970 RepID=UPI0010578E63|nr:hypothetical protein [Paenibacillus montanisoli]